MNFDDIDTGLTLVTGGAPRHADWAPIRDTIVHVVGARLNFVKMAPVIVALVKCDAFC